MARTTPTVDASGLHEFGVPTVIPLESPIWQAWLGDEAHHTFHFHDASGGFTARKERKQRGGWYWVAYRQVHGTLHKAYLGKSDALTHECLAAISRSLAIAAGANPPDGDHD